ncbi:MAG: ImmA/IrrE family metallo-endopeptidase, partial [Opitutales bacterium]
PAGSKEILALPFLIKVKTAISSSLRYGKRERFMIELLLDDDPASDLDSPEGQASWGALKLWAGGVNLCVHYEDGELRDTVNWNWWEMLQWFVGSWDFLLHEQPLPLRNKDEWAAAAMRWINQPETFMRGGSWDQKAEIEVDRWFRRHCLWACRDGGLLPNVVFRRFFADVEISWTSDNPPGAPAHFAFQLTEGGFRLPVEEVALPLFQFLKHAADYIEQATGTAIAKRFKKRVPSLEADNFSGRRLAILAGLETHGKWEKLLGKIKTSLSETEWASAKRWFLPESGSALFVPGTCQAALMFGAHAPALKDGDRIALAREIATHSASAKQEDRILSKREQLGEINPASREEPWLSGYQLAESWEEMHETGGKETAFPIEAHLDALGVEVNEIDLSDWATSGVAVAISGHPPLILLNSRFPRHVWRTARRFTLAHELCHLIADRQAGAELVMLSGAWAPVAVEKRANAFAAALLMSDKRIAAAYNQINSSPEAEDFEALQEAAKILEVSVEALCQHLCNRGYIDEGQRDMFQKQLREELAGPNGLASDQYQRLT